MVEVIKEQLLKKCTVIFDDIASAEADNFFGTPPSVFYVDFGFGDKRKIGYYVTDLQETYKYENGVMEKVEIGSRNRIEPVSGMYFPEGHASIGIDKKNGYAFLSFSVGPRYGRGFQYEIVNDEDGQRLGKEQMLWMS